mmetsp:Transcript_17269/g.45019  ORF Transcript_17269/g.45019 Transcript_17269/m.45019 type:complete len:503 (+) Transcript_17269:181-1689(+)|eukprot:CAMPEP_0182926822 /NCGR_PEP_ID=MMETSP0105_2-20130417/12323_1 /TAXON_ID=81532 ORGANISM="Acanthoeca-like sp., Strain 10tr" /NCGR_SAMPLE_ID=MMETSP0105_2 /ASSEMBLY_ACC=CAM_ASM_000205 /LENGTH=502 /DNA_ID=CAMNT_0025064733 /DNA_START=105 /DNA_END=1613 /DNA_ORIENTATION=-
MKSLFWSMALGTATLATARPVEVVQFAQDTAVLPYTIFVSSEAGGRPSPYTVAVTAVEAVSSMASAVVYGQLVFDDSYAIVPATGDSDDEAENYATLVGYKELNADLKVLFSVGGPNFPTHAWSKMAADESARATFVASVQAMASTHSFDGIEIYWEHPGSSAKTIWVGSNDGGYTAVADYGGSEDDLTNLVTLLTELRSAVGDSFLITLSVGRDSGVWASALSSLNDVVNVYFVKAFDYVVSSRALGGGSATTAAAQPMSYSPYGSVNETLLGYISAGMTAYKTTVAVAAHGQAYHLPDMRRDAWDQFGLDATIPGLCAYPFNDTHGAYPSAATGACGELTMSEILIGIADTTSTVPTPAHDSVSGSDIAFLPRTQTWVSYTGPSAVAALMELVHTYRLGGVALHTLDTDVVSAGPSYNLTVELCQNFFGVDDSRCVLVETTPAPSTDDCSSGTEGVFCLSDGTGFIFCPQEVTEYCPQGTVCKPLDSTVMCDWPDDYWRK